MISALTYVNTQKAPLYRAIMRVFVESKGQFVVHLRPMEVVERIRVAGVLEMSDVPGQEEIGFALSQLCEWGNLETHPDTAQARAVEDFYNPRPTFQMTSQGEAAERALAFYGANSAGGYTLQCSGLPDIRVVLQELQEMSHQSESDAGKIHRNLLVLFALFEELPAAAPRLIDRLDRGMDLAQPELRRLIDYGERFIGELEREADDIAAMVREMEASGFERLLQAAVGRNVRESVDATQEAAADTSRQWRSHWEQLRIWFAPQGGLVSNADRLRERARAAMPALLRIVAGGNDERIQRIDRSSDFRVLARWFAQAGSDADAHVLWRAAFGLCPARHLIINEATLDEREAQAIPANTSWLDAPPLRVSTAISSRRGNSRTGGLSRIIDRGDARERLSAAVNEEAQRLLSAQRRFGTGNRIRLSELHRLETDEFELFLDLLGEAVSARLSPAEAVEILSGDGSLRVRLEPTGDDRTAVMMTSEGMLSGPDQWISIQQISTHEVPEVVA